MSRIFAIHHRFIVKSSFLLIIVSAAGGWLYFFPENSRANSAPLVTAVHINTVSADSSQDQSPIIPVEGTTRTVYINGTYQDDDGCTDVSGSSNPLSAVFYRTDIIGGGDCTADSNNCYRLAANNCSILDCSSPSSTIASFSCSFPLQYYADRTDSGANGATDWTAAVTATDQASATGMLTNSTEVASLVSLDVPATLEFGTLAINAISAEQTLVFTNWGNQTIDGLVSAANFTCTTGTFPSNAIIFSPYSGSSFSSTSASTSPVTFSFNLAPLHNSPAASGITSTYWKLAMPVPDNVGVFGYAGSCSTVTTVVATGV